jgi:two-component system chemotaxis sensor kinase CheA
VVDEIKDTEEIVVKPLSRQLKHLDCFAGASILGDGRVVLILDALGLARSAGMLSEQRYAQDMSHNGQAEVDHVSLLLFRLHESGQMAMPLERVSRLEELPRGRIEYAGQKPVIQYREQILPLVDLCRYFSPPAGSRASKDQDPFQVIVCNHHGQMVGLIVGEILDIVDKPVTSRTNGTRRGVQFSAVIQGLVTEVIDVTQVVESAVPEFLQAPKSA